MDRIYRYRMTTTSGGNLSIREANGDIWVTPARVDKGSLRRDDIVHALLPAAHEIDLPLAENCAASLDNRPLRLVQPEQNAALHKDRRLG